MLVERREFAPKWARLMRWEDVHELPT